LRVERAFRVFLKTSEGVGAQALCMSIHRQLLRTLVSSFLAEICNFLQQKVLLQQELTLLQKVRQSGQYDFQEVIERKLSSPLPDLNVPTLNHNLSEEVLTMLSVQSFIWFNSKDWPHISGADTIFAESILIKKNILSIDRYKSICDSIINRFGCICFYPLLDLLLLMNEQSEK